MRGGAGEVREGQGAKSVCEEQPRASFPTANYYYYDPLIRTKEMEKSNFEAVFISVGFFWGGWGAELMERRRKFIGSGFRRWTGWVF